jgi:hypothetical protein
LRFHSAFSREGTRFNGISGKLPAVFVFYVSAKIHPHDRSIPNNRKSCKSKKGKFPKIPPKSADTGYE